MVSLEKFLDYTGNLVVNGNGTVRGLIGDSLTVGAGIGLTTGTGLGTLLTDRMSWNSNNTAQGGNAVADQAANCFMFSPVQGDIYTYWLGTNDKNLGGNITNRETVSQSGHLACVLHLATKGGSNKIHGQSMTAAGTWVNLSNIADAKGVISSTNGSTLTCSVSGTSIALVGYWNSLQSGIFSVSIDGVSKGTFNCTPPGGVIPSNIGLTYGPFALTFGGLSSGSHTVVITVTSATNASNVVYVAFVAGYGSTINVADPLVVVANTHDYTSAANTAQGTNTAQNTRYKNAIAANVALAQSLGLNVKLVDVDALIGGSGTLLSSDGIHPTVSGYAAILSAFATAIG